MDPKETLLQLDQYISDCDYPSAIDRLNDYYQWRLRGGFEPTGLPCARATTGDAFADYCATRLSDAVLADTPEGC